MFQSWESFLVAFVWMMGAYIYGREDGQKNDFIRGATLLVLFAIIVVTRLIAKGF